MTKILTKLLEIQKRVQPLVKNNQVEYLNKKYKYYDINDLLEMLRPILNELKLVVIQPLQDKKLITQLFDVESGEKIESNVDLPECTDPQKFGAIITYYRRYSLTSMFLLEAEDTDANDTKPLPPKTAKPLPKQSFEPNEDRNLQREAQRVTKKCAVCQTDFQPISPNYTKCPKCYFVK